MSEPIGRKEFSEDTRKKCLLWSDRHCCLCGKPCGTDIVIHHIRSEEDNSLDNAIPLCYNCHAEIHRYNDEVPVGSKYKPEELITRRDQIYERYTRHVVPPIDFRITQLIGMRATERSPLPRVGFNISHLGDFLPVRARIKARVFLGRRDLGLIENPEKPYYSGILMWNLNPRHMFYGNFSIPKECVDSNEDLKIEVQVTIIDMYDKSHELLPVCYTYVRKDNYWFTEPTSSSELRRFMNR